MRPLNGGDDVEEPDQPSSLEILKSVWKISDKKPPREVPPEKVNTNIYNVPQTGQRIPHRPRPSR